MSVLGINHIAISTPDLERAIRFYCDVLGLEAGERFEYANSDMADAISGLTGVAVRGVYLEAPNLHLELFEFSSPPPAPQDSRRPVCDHGITHISFATDDVDALYERACGLGMHFHCAPQDDPSGARLTYGRDPDGNVVEIIQL